MNFKRLTLAITAGLMALSLCSGCGDGQKADNSDNATKPGATPTAKVEMPKEPTYTVPVGNKSIKIYELEGGLDEDFNFTGERLAFAGDCIYLHGEEEIPGKDEDLEGLYKLPLQGNTLGKRELVAESPSGDEHRNLTVAGDKVLFQLKEGDKLGLYNGKSLDKSDSKWKDDYDAMMGFAEGKDLLLVRSLDTICTARQELTEVTGIKEVVKDAREVLKLKDARAVRPVYADANELYVSCETDADDFTSDLFSFDKNGKPLKRFEGLKGEGGEWAVTKDYVLQASYGEAVLIYERSTGKKIYDSSLKDVHIGIFCSAGGNLLLCYDNVKNKFFFLEME